MIMDNFYRLGYDYNNSFLKIQKNTKLFQKLLGTIDAGIAISIEMVINVEILSLNLCRSSEFEGFDGL